MQLRIWANGELFDDPAEARVPVTDHGLVVGDGIFEALKVTPAGPFALSRHLRRMDRSAAAMGLPAPDHAVIREAVQAVLADVDLPLGKIRITYTGGRGPLGSGAAYGPQTLVVAVEPVDPSPPSSTIVTAPWSRNEFGALAGVKSTSYAENVRALAYATERAASEAIFPNTAGNLCEGTGANIFCVFGSTVVTPPLADGALAGITRELVLEWCDVEERTISMAEAKAADEVFLTSSLRDVQQVDRWDDLVLPPARPVTTRIADVFATRAAVTTEP